MNTQQLFPLGDNLGYVQQIHKHEDVLLSVVNSARISYNKNKDKEDSKDKKLAGFLWANNHTSPFRHQFYTFNIKAPLFIFRQWHKHQIGCPWSVITADGEEVTLDLAQIKMDTDNGTSWNEVSGRYVVLKPEFYIPQRYRSNAGHANKQASSDLKDWTDEQHKTTKQLFTKICHESYKGYQELLDQGVAKEMARMLLPQNIYSSAVWTPSLQAVIHFLSLRLKPDAQWEIRQYAEAIKTLIQPDLEQIGIDL
jgi:thymidylate synthase (FAD)